MTDEGAALTIEDHREMTSLRGWGSGRGAKPLKNVNKVEGAAP